MSDQGVTSLFDGGFGPLPRNIISSDAVATTRIPLPARTSQASVSLLGWGGAVIAGSALWGLIYAAACMI